MLAKLINKSQVEGLVRTGAAAAGGYFVAKGYDASLVNELAGAGVVAVMALWSYWVKRT